MTSASKYWEFVKLDTTSKRRVEMIAVAKTYFQRHFPDLHDVADVTVQCHLWQIQHDANGEREDKFLAELCLRCYVSHQIYQVCLDLGMKFGSKNGFTYQDLLPYVLDDEVLEVAVRQPQQLSAWLNTHRSQQGFPGLGNSSYQSLATNILKTFDPTKGSLSAWVSRYVKQHPELKRFLLQHGVFLVSDWALLNDTNPKELQRILTTIFGLSQVEIEQACELLVSYHGVYRQDRLQQRMAGGMLKCQPPTTHQLARIANDFQSRLGKSITPDTVFKQLQLIALKLRQYRIAAQGGAITSVSFDREEIRPMVEATQVTTEDDEQVEFIRLYQAQFSQALDEAIAQVLADAQAKIQRKRGTVEQQFTTALHLFHCQGQSMSQIAPLIGLKKQYEVTRLLKLNDLRADIRQNLLLSLRSRILELAENFTDSSRLQALDQKLEGILDEQISSLIQENESEAKNPIRNQPLRSLLARRICHYLQSQERKGSK